MKDQLAAHRLQHLDTHEGALVSVWDCLKGKQKGTHLKMVGGGPVLTRPIVYPENLKLLGLIPHSFQPSFFPITSCFPKAFGDFLERRIPGKNGEATNRKIALTPDTAAITGAPVCRSPPAAEPADSTRWGESPSKVRTGRGGTKAPAIQQACVGTPQPKSPWCCQRNRGWGWIGSFSS